MPELHEFSDEELRRNLASGELGDKKAVTAHAVLRRRRRERIQAWLKKHAWLGTILAAIGLAGIFAVISPMRPNKRLRGKRSAPSSSLSRSMTN
jgi:hypothetical protein